MSSNKNEDYDIITCIKHFVLIVAISSLIIMAALLVATYPVKYIVKIVFGNPKLDLMKYYFYYQKATAYRMLFIVHTFINNACIVVGAMATFITTYCAVKNNNYVILYSLIAALCQVISLTIPSQTYMRVYVQSARIMEYALNDNYDNCSETEIYKKLELAYEKAEDLIAKDFV